MLMLLRTICLLPSNTSGMPWYNCDRIKDWRCQVAGFEWKARDCQACKTSSALPAGGVGPTAAASLAPNWHRGAMRSRPAPETPDKRSQQDHPLQLVRVYSWSPASCGTRNTEQCDRCTLAGSTPTRLGSKSLKEVSPGRARDQKRVE